MGLFSTGKLVATEVALRQKEDRDRLVLRLSEGTKMVQHEYHDRDEPVPSCELTNDLCRSLEALFIHGLRDTFLDKVSSVMSETRPPEPNFWPPVQIVSHSNVIHEIVALSQIRSDIGKARAWLRAALNEGLLTSYIAMMREDRRLLGSYYFKSALFRDDEQMDIVQSYLQGLEALRFALATNSTLLNTWDEASLELAGVWFRPRPAGAGSLVQGQDVAASIAAPVCRPQPPAELALPLPEPQMPTLIMNALEPDMAFDVIMRTTAVERVLAPQPQGAAGGPVVPAAPSTAGGGSGLNSEASSMAGELAAITTPRQTYISMLESYRENCSPRARSLMQTPDVQFVFGRSANSSVASSEGGRSELEMSGESEQQQEQKPADSASTASTAVPGDPAPAAPVAPAASADPAPAPAVTEKPPQNTQEAPDDPPPKPVDSRYRWLTEFCVDGGLDSQRYTCGGCQRFVGMLYGEPRSCSFDGRFYCNDCHTGKEQAQLPARIVLNWDFDRYPVARCSLEFLELVDAEPAINIADSNISLYHISADMDRVRLLRTRLVFLNAFLHTCRSGAAAELDRRLAGRRHLCEHVHLYAPVDLRDTNNGSLETTLQAIVEFAVEHVRACSLCSQKGFVCEFCNDPRIIYPFELELTRQCRQCYGLYHSRCWRRPAACPRCERYRRRNELRQLLEEPQLSGPARTQSSPAGGCQEGATKERPAASTEPV